jgi:hypothetical protein
MHGMDLQPACERVLVNIQKAARLAECPSFNVDERIELQQV